MRRAIHDISEGSALTKRDVQRLETRARLRDLSIAEFRRVGFADADIATIAASADVSRGTFYFHFPTKEDVLVDLELEEERRIAGEVSALAAAGAGLEVVLQSVVAGITEAETRLGADLMRDVCSVHFRGRTPASTDPADHPLATALIEAVEHSLVRAGVLPDVNEPVEVAVLFLVGMFGLLSSSDGPSEARRRLIDRLVNLTTERTQTRCCQ